MPKWSWLSTSGWPRIIRPSNRPRAVVHTKGCCWGPEKIGPVTGWFTRVRSTGWGRRPVPVALTVSVLSPSTSPVTRPTRAPSSPAEKAAVTSVSPSSTRTRSGGMPSGRPTRTRASPPLTWSARPESTVTSKRFGPAAGRDAAGAATASVVASATSVSAAPSPRGRRPPDRRWRVRPNVAILNPPCGARPFSRPGAGNLAVTSVTCNGVRLPGRGPQAHLLGAGGPLRYRLPGPAAPWPRYPHLQPLGHQRPAGAAAVVAHAHAPVPLAADHPALAPAGPGPLAPADPVADGEAEGLQRRRLDHGPSPTRPATSGGGASVVTPGCRRSRLGRRSGGACRPASGPGRRRGVARTSPRRGGEG